jgi:hypothetical protein
LVEGEVSESVVFSVPPSSWKQSGRSGAVAVGEEAEVADAHESRRQQVEQEAAQKLFDS